MGVLPGPFSGRSLGCQLFESREFILVHRFLVYRLPFDTVLSLILFPYFPFSFNFFISGDILLIQEFTDINYISLFILFNKISVLLLFYKRNFFFIRPLVFKNL